jgi:DNA-binding IclR family transcriptional regulator
MKRPVNATQLRHETGLRSAASQTLVRGLDVLEVVAGGPLALPALANRLGLARSTTHRLATALLERRYLTLVPREGYGLGPKLLELGSCAQEQTALVRVARPYLESLAAESLETAFLCICDEGGVTLLERVPGHRRLLPTLRVGERMQIAGAAPGYALLMDSGENAWRVAFAQDFGDLPNAAFLAAMRRFASLGYAFDTDVNEEGIRSVAAPVRDSASGIVAALGLSTAAHYLNDKRLAALGAAAMAAANALSADLGYTAAALPASPAMAGGGDPPRERVSDLPQNNEVFGRAEATRHLEAEARSVHDPASQGSRRAANPDKGVTLRPASSAPAKSG